MRTIRTKVYKFNELTPEAQEVAIQWYRNSSVDSDYAGEIIDSAKKLAEVFNLKFGREYGDLKTSHIDDDILQLSGVRLYKYLVNNYYNELFTPKYIKSIDRSVRWKQFICKGRVGQAGAYTQIYSKLRRDNSCVLTGVCYDYNLLQPVYDFLKHPDKSETFEELINEMGNAISKTFRDEEEYVNSDEYIKETIEANEYEFTKEGNKF